MKENENRETQWSGRDVYDMDGDKIGTVQGARRGVVGDAVWLVVKTELVDAGKILVPASEVRSAGDRLSVPYTKERVRNSPQVDAHALSESAEGELCRYFGLQYLGAATEPAEGCVDMKDKQDYRAAG
jgi:sporulation protein YlmC with PRC-barrel domain